MTDLERAVTEIAERVVERLAPKIDELVRAAVANANHSRARSPAGIGAPVEGDDRCDEATNRGSMDPTSTETCGDSMSLLEAEEDGRRLIEAIQRGTSPKPRSRAHVRRRKALP